jgi:hypothetical protein
MPSRRDLTVRKGCNWARAATHCIRGHPFDQKNTRWTGDGWRTCRSCHRERAQRERAKA